MMHAVSSQGASSINLQATLSASSAVSAPGPSPHHPITCQSALRYEPDGTLRCEHAVAPADDERTKHCVQQSVAVLIMECAASAFG